MFASWTALNLVQMTQTVDLSSIGKGDKCCVFIVVQYIYIYEPFNEKRSFITFPISVDLDKPAHPNYQFFVLLVDWFVKEALNMLLANGVHPDQTAWMHRLIWDYTGHKCDKGPFLIKIKSSFISDSWYFIPDKIHCHLGLREEPDIIF